MRRTRFLQLAIIIFSLSASLTASLIHPLPIVEAQSPSADASTFAPVLHFVSGEKFYPTSVESLIGSSVVKQRHSDGTSTLVDPSPSNSSLGSYNSSEFLDNKLGTLDAIANDLSSKYNGIGPYVYVHVVNSTSSTVIQYWLFYGYNNGPLNDHQGDLEVVQVFLDSSGNPQTAVYSQHGAGENAAWVDVEKVGTHPVVYVALGSHANYFRPYQGKIGVENDIVGSNGITINPTDLRIVILGNQGIHPANQGWLDFPGRWGFVGTDQDIALGRAGPLGPVFNQNGTRWSDPQRYLSSTLTVTGNYFILAFLAAYFLLIFFAYLAARAAWKIISIVRLYRKKDLRAVKFLRSGGFLGLAVGIVSIVITIIALFLPWYTISATSQSRPLAAQGPVTLLSVDGINGILVNLFTGAGGDSTSGYTSLFFLQIPFAIILGVGIVLLTMDIIGVRSGKKLSHKFILGAIGSLLPFILIYVIISQLPSFLPLASGLLPGQSIPPQLDSLIRSVASNPVAGSASQQFPVVGTTTVNWGYALGAYLFLAAAIVRIAGGLLLRRVPELKMESAPPPSPPPTSPSPGPSSSQP